MIPQFNSIILDVVVVVLLLSVIALGAFKGIKHIAINFALFIGSLALSLTSLTNVIKSTITSLLASKINFGAGVADEVKVGMALLYNLIAALLLAILFYVILRLLKAIICFVIKRKKLKLNQLPSTPNKISRITGALFSLVFNGAFVIVLLSIFALPLVGGNKTMDSGYVAKHVEKADDAILDAIMDENLLEEKLLVKLVRGDVLVKVSDEDARAIVKISELVGGGKLIPEKIEEPQVNLDYLHAVLLFINNQALDENGVEVDGFEKAVELTRDAVAKAINQMNSLHGEQEPIEAKNTLAISNLVKKLGLKESAETFETIFVMK